MLDHHRQRTPSQNQTERLVTAHNRTPWRGCVGGNGMEVDPRKRKSLLRLVMTPGYAMKAPSETLTSPRTVFIMD